MMHPVPHLSQRNARYFQSNSSENDAISHTSPIRTQQHPHQSSTNNNYHYAADHNTPLFQNMHRRKSNHHHHHDDSNTSFVQTAMKVVLLSPVLVLVIWSITAISWTNHHMKLIKESSVNSSQSRQQQRNWMLLNRNRRAQQQQQQLQVQQQQQPVMYQQQEPVIYEQQQLQQQEQFILPPQPGAPLIVQPSFIKQQEGQPIQGSTEDYYEDPIPIVGMSPNARGISPQLSDVVDAPSIALSDSHGSDAIMIPNPETTSMFSTGKKQYYYTFPEEQQVQEQQQRQSSTAFTNKIAVYDPVTGKTQYYYSVPELDAVTEPQKEPIVLLENTADGTLIKQPSQTSSLVEDTAMLAKAQPLRSTELQLPIKSLLSTNHKGGSTTTTNSKNHLRRNNDNHHASKHNNNDKVKYYFYDPKDTKKDQHGRIHLPQYVYDTYGRLVSFKALSVTLQNGDTSTLPKVTMIHHNVSTTNVTIFNFTHTHPPTVETRQKRKMSLLPSWQQLYSISNYTTTAINHNNNQHYIPYTSSDTNAPPDSSMIICTVGVMALLVGALSARRMRSHQQRSILSICIENENLEDDAAYDTIYTTTTTNNPNNHSIFGSSSHYNTFAQGWKGDLEKFDV